MSLEVEKLDQLPHFTPIHSTAHHSPSELYVRPDKKRAPYDIPFSEVGDETFRIVDSKPPRLDEWDRLVKPYQTSSGATWLLHYTEGRPFYHRPEDGTIDDLEEFKRYLAERQYLPYKSEARGHTGTIKFLGTNWEQICREVFGDTGDISMTFFCREVEFDEDNQADSPGSNPDGIALRSPVPGKVLRSVIEVGRGGKNTQMVNSLGYYLDEFGYRHSVDLLKIKYKYSEGQNGQGDSYRLNIGHR